LRRRYAEAPVEKGVKAPDGGQGLAERAGVQRAIPAAALLVVFSLPLFGIKLGIDLGLASVADTPSGKGEIVLAEEFTPGMLSPMQILASHEGDGPLTTDDLVTIDRFTTAMAADGRVAAIY